MVGMKRPIFVRPLADAEREALEEGGPALAGRLPPPPLPGLARKLQVRERLRHRPLVGLRLSDGGPHRHKALQRGRTRRGPAHTLFKAKYDPRRLRRGTGRTLARDASPHSPREFGKGTSLWTLELAAEVSFEEGLTEGRVTGETVRASLERMGGDAGCGPRSVGSPPPTPSTPEKRRRDRLIRLSEDNHGWVVGFEDETWWSRVGPFPRCASGARTGSPSVWCSGRSPKTIPTRRPSPPATGCTCPNSTGGRGCASWTAVR